MGADIKLRSKKTGRIADGDRAYVIQDTTYDLPEDIEMPNLYDEYINKKDILFYLEQLKMIEITTTYCIDYGVFWLSFYIDWIKEMDEDDSFRFFRDNDDDYDVLKSTIGEKFWDIIETETDFRIRQKAECREQQIKSILED